MRRTRVARIDMPSKKKNGRDAEASARS